MPCNPRRSPRDRQLASTGACKRYCISRGHSKIHQLWGSGLSGLGAVQAQTSSGSASLDRSDRAPGLSYRPGAPWGAATSPPLPGPREAALPVNSPPCAAPSPPRLHPRGTLGGVRLARTRCHSPDASPPSFPTAGRPAVFLVHGGAEAEGSPVPGSLALAGRSARTLT